MALVQKCRVLNPRTLMGLISQTRGMGHYVTPKPWNYLWKPGPYPRTEEERIKAAKKYGLIPEDYKPFPEESMNGDYPDLKPSSADSRDGNVYWDMPEFRRNFGEPMHHDFDFQQETRYDDTTRQRYTLLEHWVMFLGTVAVVTFPIFLFWNTPIGLPMTCHQIPRKGDPHVYYTFEPAEK